MIPASAAAERNTSTVTANNSPDGDNHAAIEDSYAWEDSRGHVVPDLYLSIARAYSRLRSATLVKGEFYRAEDKAEVFRFDGVRLVSQSALPHRAAVIVVPAKLFDEIKNRLSR